MARKPARGEDRGGRTTKTDCCDEKSRRNGMKGRITRRVVLKTGFVAPLVSLIGHSSASRSGGGLPGGSESTAVDTTEPAMKDGHSPASCHTIVLNGTGIRSAYELTVEGPLWLHEGPKSRYEPSGSSAEALLESNRIQYGFLGEVTDFRVDGAITVFVDGDEINPNDQSF